MTFDVLSPDGISIWGDVYPSRAAAESALQAWVKRFAWQGFYSTSRWERIPLDEIAGRCRIVAVDSAGIGGVTHDTGASAGDE
jgi:hypothetical protein